LQFNPFKNTLVKPVFQFSTKIKSTKNNSLLPLPYLTGGFVPIYILLSTLTSEGRKTIRKRPERIKEVDKEIEALGAKVLQQYAVLGRYDFINIVEAPNNEAIMRVSIELGARGTVQITSMPATPIDEFLAMIKK
jgi:uncharacterized protein with GYD domain